MPEADSDAPVPATNTAIAPHATPSADKDRVGEELADDARIWRVYDQVARADDKDRIDTWNRGLDNLALFAGLVSAVTTAFIIEAQKDLKVDYSQLTFLALNASANGVPFVQQPFVIPSSARTITCLWVASLVLSLSAALIAIMGKDWIGMYAARPVCNARQWAEMRTYRLLCVERWYMSGVIASAPVLLHVSLLLFGAGLVLFISWDPLTHHLTLGLSLAAGGLYLVTALSAIAFPASPFKSPATQMIRGAFAATLRSLLFHSKRNLVGKVHIAISRIIAPDLDSISRDQRRILPMFLRRDTNRLTEEGRNRLSALRRARNFAYTTPLSAFVISRHFLRDAGRQMRPSKIASAWIGSREFLIGACIRIASAVCSLLVRPLFVGSPWTTVRSHRSPARLAKALSWLNNASLEPEVLRAIMIALGDLDIGSEVTPLISADLRTRVRADIRFNWQKADFPTLSRYVLADRNLPEHPLINYSQFKSRFPLKNEPHLRCEEGLAALIMASASSILVSDIQEYCPRVVSQPRMLHLLLPRLSWFHRGYISLIELTNCYMNLLSQRDLRDLEALFLQCVDSGMREGYRKTIRNGFGGQSGILELMVYLIVEADLDEDSATSATKIIFHILPSFLLEERRWCVAYLFSSVRPALQLAEQRLTDTEAFLLLASLPLRTYLQYKWDDSDTPPQPQRRRPMESALARSVIDILSPARWDRSGLWRLRNRHKNDRYDDLCTRFLHVQLCHRNSLLTDDDKIIVIGDILTKATLLSIRSPGPSGYCWFEPPHRLEGCIDILAAIVRHLTPRLQVEASQSRDEDEDVNTQGSSHLSWDLRGNSLDMSPGQSREEGLFGLLVHSDENTQGGSHRPWDLGRYLRGMSSRIPEEPSLAGALRRLLSELQTLYPVCRDSPALLLHWNRIGLPAAVDDWKYETDDELIAFFETCLKIEQVRAMSKKGGVRLSRAADEPQQGAPDFGAAEGEQATVTVHRTVPEYSGGRERKTVLQLYASLM